ncbi:hypothetical protein Q1695_011256 [Nippostrongylus brasiliensis]|nr:hypothetical protein Q1695_011256 [Nippostrongylus brasiliensis]
MRLVRILFLFQFVILLPSAQAFGRKTTTTKAPTTTVPVFCTLCKKLVNDEIRVLDTDGVEIGEELIIKLCEVVVQYNPAMTPKMCDVYLKAMMEKFIHQFTTSTNEQRETSLICHLLRLCPT